MARPRGRNDAGVFMHETKTAHALSARARGAHEHCHAAPAAKQELTRLQAGRLHHPAASRHSAAEDIGPEGGRVSVTTSGLWMTSHESFATTRTLRSSAS